MTYDVAVIGGGVIGCALARRYAVSGARTVLLEKAADILDGASKGNSAILHTGFDAPPGSLEAACIAEGRAEYLAIRERLGLPLMETGALVLAWTEEQAESLAELMDQARANGVTDVEAVTREEVLTLEPNLAPGVQAGFRVPGESVIDPWSAPLAYLLQAVAHGAEVRRSCPVTGGQFDGTLWHLDTPQGPVDATLVVNAAGLYGDRVDQTLLGKATSPSARARASSWSTTSLPPLWPRTSFCRCPRRSPRAWSSAAPLTATCLSDPRRKNRTTERPPR